MQINVGVSNHHVHLTREALDLLFGEGYELTKKRELTQIGQFAAHETVNLELNGRLLENIRIIGPCRNYTQVELLERDNEFFQIKAPIRTSGDLKGSETINIIGPKGILHAVESTIVADRHIHMSAEDLVTVLFENGVKLDDVHIKSDETCKLELHMNKDEAEKLGIETGMKVSIC